MKISRVAAAAIGAFAIVTVGSNPASALSKCSGSKIKSAGKKAAAKLTCLSKTFSKGLAEDSTCLAKAEIKFSSALAKADAKGPDCLTTGDRVPIEAKVDALHDDIDGLVQPPAVSKCDGAKVKAAGKKAAAKLTCISKAVTKGVLVDSTCLAKAEIKFSSAAAKAEAKVPTAPDVGCTATGDFGAYEAFVDASVDDIGLELGGCPDSRDSKAPCADCCATANQLSFTTVTGVGNSGALYDAGGTNLASLVNSGLYFGGSGVSVPLPSVVPDMGVNFNNVTACASGALTYGPTLIADTGSIKTCSSATESNPLYQVCAGGDATSRIGRPCDTDPNCGPNTGCIAAGNPAVCCSGSQAGTCVASGTCTANNTGCLFGPPLPVPNAVSSAVSTCVINRYTTDSAGSGTCAGAISLGYNLGSDLYLTGDFSPAPGINPCPICNAGICDSGPNNGLACVAGSGALGGAGPTSHDCPPPGANYIGTLPIPFALTTSWAADVATDTDGAGGQTEVFCGFCRSTVPPNPFRNPPTACTSNADCSGFAPFTACRQRNEGAFTEGLAHQIAQCGTQPTCLTDGMGHGGTLVSVFCVPPSYTGLVDASADLAGPGAVSLPGTAQLLP